MKKILSYWLIVMTVGLGACTTTLPEKKAPCDYYATGCGQKIVINHLF